MLGYSGVTSIPEYFWEPNEKEFGKLNSQGKLLRKYVDGIFTSHIDRDDHNKCVPLSGSRNIEDECYLRTEKFNYTMNILDEKLTSLYRLCRHTSDQQQTTNNR
ncbi:hypothetical protein RhiirC2_784928 [Rhizophagus irregularis]|uniref:Uncharacterized protein n=1 Tax=Rhizophagus irregularis TaxID=588596 RepID=A0A2N1MXG1_9GLOM|nr:hypothetical protein RhiirC2_784928 [Rhizophagus irregularis]